METSRNKTKVATVTLTLLLTITVLSVLAPTIPITAQKQDIVLGPYLYPVIGEDTATSIIWEPFPNMFLPERYGGIEGSAYAVEPWEHTDMWPNATITFTRPDATTDVLQGPFDVYWVVYEYREEGYYSIGFDPRFQVIYTPDMQGQWYANFSWPGDSTYNAYSRVSPFWVGPHLPKRKQFCLMSLRPNPIGLNQKVLVNAWLTPPPLTAFENLLEYTFTFTRPDQTSFQIGPMPSEVGGFVWFEIPIDQLGDWTVKFDYPGDFFNEPDTLTETLVCQQDPIPYPVPDTPLPTEAWSFPINVFNREWRNIAGSWFQPYYNASRIGWNRYSEAVRSSHVLWKLPQESGLGGLMGAPYPIQTSGHFSGSASQIEVIMAGRGYYDAGGNIICLDMFTGEELWRAPGAVDYGAIRNGVPWLYDIYGFGGTRFREFNGLTGAPGRDIDFLPARPPVPEPYTWDGFQSVYRGNDFFVDPYIYRASSGYYNDSTRDFNDGYVTKWDTRNGQTVWNVTFPAGCLTGSYSVIHDNILVSRSFKGGTIIVHYLKGLNLETGDIEYETPIMDQDDPDTWVYRQGPAIGAGHGKVYFAGTAYGDQPLSYFCFNVEDGSYHWVFQAFDPADFPWTNFFAYSPQISAYNMIYVLTYRAIFAVNITTGELEWRFFPGDSGMETPYGSWPFGSTGPLSSGGVLYAPSTEHSPTLYYRGTRMYGIDVFTGEEEWNILGYFTPDAVAYGILVARDQSNDQTYAFGKGQSETTVSVTDSTISKGDIVGIKGTILDQSPAQPGTPCVSKDSMSAWMEYLHMQQPAPMDTVGVPVTLQAKGSDGTISTIATVTSDASGDFAYTWTPPDEDTYTILAWFPGDDSYWGSYDQTHVFVGPEPAAQPADPPTADEISTEVEGVLPDYEPLLLGIIAAVVVLIIVGIVNLWALRKR